MTYHRKNTLTSLIFKSNVRDLYTYVKAFKSLSTGKIMIFYFITLLMKQ